MTIGKASALVAGFVGAMALGVWMSPYIRDEGRTLKSDTAAVETDRAQAPAQRAAARIARISPEAPALHDKLKPLLKQGTDMTLADDGFRSAEQFATVAHAADNTDVPFVVLKHRVLTERRPLATAIRLSRPDINADIEAERARAEARSDLAALGS